MINNPQVTIKYRTSYGTQPSDNLIQIFDPLTLEQLPELEASNYKFLGWVHINSDGHESSLSERMLISNDWLMLDSNLKQYVVFTAKWRNDRKTGTAAGEIYDGDYIVTPKVTQQSLLTADKYMEDDVTVKSIPYYNVSNTAGGSSVYIGSEI